MGRLEIFRNAASLAVLVTTRANAVPIVLDFEGLEELEAVDDFYNGGTGGNGSGPGTDFGIEFSPNTIALIDADAGGSGNFGGEPSPDTIMFFLTGAASIMNVAAGFDTGFSLFYSAINNSGSVSVFDGLDGTGTLLGTLALPTTPSNGGDPTGDFSPFFATGVGFAGIARSVSLAGVQDQIGFDDITFGSTTPGVVPEPTTVALLGIGLVGLAGVEVRRRRNKKAVVVPR